MATKIAPNVVATHRIVTLGQLWQIPLFVAGVGMLLTVWLTRPLWYDPESLQLERDLEHARTILSQPNAPANEITLILADALTRGDRFPERIGEIHYLLGSAYVRLAEGMPVDQAKSLWIQACTQLEQAEVDGVPDEDRAVLVYRLSKVWFYTGVERQKILPYLSASIDALAQYRWEALHMLTQLYLRPAVDLQAALKANERQLQLPIEDERLLGPVRLLRGELLLQVPDRDGARKVLARITARAAPAVYGEARYLRARSLQEDEAWADAAKLWEEILADKSHPIPQPGRVLYSLGLCYRRLNQPQLNDQMIVVLEQACALGGEEAQAAQILLAQLLRESGKYADSLARYDRALALVNQPEHFKNQLIGLPQLQAALKLDCEETHKAGDHETAYRLAKLYARIATPFAGNRMVAQMGEALGRSNAKTANQQQTSREQLREAARTYEIAAGQTGDQAERGQALSHAAECHADAQDHSQAIVVLGQLLALSPSADRLNEIWYRLGEAHEKLGDDKAAEGYYEKAFTTAGRFKHMAGLQWALLEKKKAEKLQDGQPQGSLELAERILYQVTQAVRFEDGWIHEKAFFEMADLHFSRANWSQAAQSWEQALRDYPASSYALTARFRLAKCYQQLASVELEAQKNKSNVIRDSNVLAIYRRREWMFLEQAAASYEKVRDDLLAKRASKSLTPFEATTLVKTQFNLAECRFDRGQFDEAIQTYNRLATDYQKQIEGLMALQQLYRCYMIIVPPNIEGAYATVSRAREMMETMGDDAFRGFPNQSREAFERFFKNEEITLEKLRLGTKKQ